MQHTQNRLLIAAAYGAASFAVCSAFVAAFIMLPDAASDFLNSDALYLAAMFRDVDLGGLAAVASWNLTPNPYFFPDMLIYAASDGVTTGFRQEIFLFAALQIWLFFIAGWLVFRELTAAAFAPYMISFWLVMAAAAFGGYALAGPYSLRWYSYAFVSGFHFGALIASLLAFHLTIACILRPASRARVAMAAALSVVMVATIVSDLVFIPYFCFPALAVLACLGLTKEYRRRVALIGVQIAVLTVAGYVLNRAINPAAGVYLNNMWSDGDSLRAFLSAIIRDAGNEQVLAACILAAVAAVTISALSGAAALLRYRTVTLPSDQGLRIFAIFAATASIVIVIVAIRSQLFVNLMTIRYILPFVFLPPLWLACLLAAALPDTLPVRRISLGASLTLGLFCAVWSAGWSTRAHLSSLFHAPPSLACFDGIGRAGILAGYWYAKPLMLFSEGRVHAVQVDPSGAPMLWINNNDWYTGRDAGAPELFSSILMDDLNEQDILNRYGPPDSVAQCGASRIWRYADARRLSAALLRESPFKDKISALAEVSPYRPGEVLDFTLSRDNARPYLADGWSITEPWGTWSNGKEARIDLPPFPSNGGDLRLHVQAQGFLAGALTRQRIEVVVNGHSVAWWDFTVDDPSGERTAVIPAQVTGLHNPLQVVFRAPTAASPASLNLSADARQLGIGIMKLQIDLAGSGGPPPG